MTMHGREGGQGEPCGGDYSNCTIPFQSCHTRCGGVRVPLELLLTALAQITGSKCVKTKINLRLAICGPLARLSPEVINHTGPGHKASCPILTFLQLAQPPLPF
jgi:hypothetical protein